MPLSPRARLRLLARSGRAEPGIFAPLVLAQAAEIEALDLQAFLYDPTKLTKGLTALHRALGGEAVVTAAADGLLAEAAGADLDWSSYPPIPTSHPREDGVVPPDAPERAAAHPRMAAAVEATARLSATLPGEPALVTALTGPGTLAEQLAGEWFGNAATKEEERVAFLEAVGQIVLAATQRFLEAGAALVVLVEEEVPPAGLSEAWRSALMPVFNVTRFHQAAPVLVVESLSAESCERVPSSIGMCVPEGITLGGPANRLRGMVLPPEPKEWTSPAGTSLVVTAGAVPGHCGFAETLAAYRRLTGA